MPSQWNQEKINQTVIEKYKVDNIFQLDSVKKKSKKTMINKYGVEYALLSNDILSQMKFKNIKKYGVEYPSQLEYFKEKQRKTLLKNYGVDHYSKTSRFREIASKNMCKYNENINTNHKIKYYKDTNIYYQSLYEYRFLEYCEKHDLLKFIDNSPTFKYIDRGFGKWHIPDFKFKEKHIIEIKSTYWLMRQGGWNKINAKKKSVEAKGYKYVIMIDENYDNFLKII
jgi:hypothetical protein